MSALASLAYWIWLSAASVSPKAKAALILHFGDAEKAYLSPKGAFSSVPGVTPLEAERLEQRDLSRVSAILGACEKQGLRILTYQDAAYPARLRTIFAPPVVLYVKGKLPELDREAAIAVIGTRKASVYGLNMRSAAAAAQSSRFSPTALTRKPPGARFWRRAAVWAFWVRPMRRSIPAWPGSSPFGAAF